MIYSVTGPSALRLLMPYIEPDTTATALRFAWQAGAGIYAALTSATEPFTSAAALPDIEDLDSAVATVTSTRSSSPRRACGNTQ
jgi:hypothetical protein